MDVGDVKVFDENGLLSCSMMVKAMNTIMKERLLTNCVAGQFVFQPLPPDWPARSTFSLRILTLAPNLHLEFYRRTVTDGMQSPCTSCCCGLEISRKVITVAKKIEKSVQRVIGSCFHSSAIKNVDHEAWRARAELFRD